MPRWQFGTLSGCNVQGNGTCLSVPSNDTASCKDVTVADGGDERFRGKSRRSDTSPPQIPHGVSRDWARDTAVKSRGLIIWAMAWRPWSEIHRSMRNRIICLFVFGVTTPQWARASSFTRFLDHTRLTTVGRTPLDKWSARRRDLYLTTKTHNTHNRQTTVHPEGFETLISVGERQ